jgi:hypothetical protein
MGTKEKQRNKTKIERRRFKMTKAEKTAVRVLDVMGAVMEIMCIWTLAVNQVSFIA